MSPTEVTVHATGLSGLNQSVGDGSRWNKQTLQWTVRFWFGLV